MFPFFLLFLFVTASPLSAAAPEASFQNVRGKVLWFAPGKAEARIARVGEVLPSGARVEVGESSSARLQTFEGATVDLSSGTRMILEELKQDGRNRTVRWKLLIGRVFAKIQELWTEKSTFEIEAGGVVCGVRGTEFQMDFDGKDKLILEVLKGKVWSQAKNGLREHEPGSRAEFRRALWLRWLQKHLEDAGDRNEERDGKNHLHDPRRRVLLHLKSHFLLQAFQNNDEAFTDPSVAGSVRVNLRLVVPPAEGAVTRQ